MARFSLSQLAVLVLVAVPGAHAQNMAPCEFPPQPFPGGGSPQAGADVAVPAPGGGGGCGAGGSPFFLSPPFGAEVPRNVQIRIGGDVSTLDMDPPTFVLEVEDATTGDRFAFSREGGLVHAVEPLPAQSAIVARLSATDANPCVGCFSVQELSFSTTDEVDLSAPVLDPLLPVHAFILPSAEEQARCGFFFNTSHQISVDLGPPYELSAFVGIAARTINGPPVLGGEMVVGAVPTLAIVNAGTLPAAIGDRFLVALQPRDIAGNRGPLRVVRVAGRSFRDAATATGALPSLTCTLPSAPVVRVAAALPLNGVLNVDFAFEEVPVGLVDDAGAQVPLVPIADTKSGHLYTVGADLRANTHYTVEALSCPHCGCRGCDTPGPLTAFTTGTVADTAPPRAPAVLSFGEDIQVQPSTGPCVPDEPALLIHLEPGVDDLTAPLDFRYDVQVSVDGAPPLALGTALVPVADDDGLPMLRVENTFGRLLAKNIVVRLTAIDAGGNRSTAEVEHAGAPAVDDGGCQSAGAPSAAGLLAVALGVAGLRRRRVQR